MVTVAGRNRHTNRSVQYAFTQLGNSHRLVLIALLIGNRRNSRCTEREVDIIGEVIGLVVLDIPTGYLQVLQIGVGRSLEFEIEFIDLGDLIARRGNADGILSAIDRGRRVISYRLLSIRVFRDSLNGRHGCCADRQRHFIHGLRRREARHGLAVDEDVLQFVISQQSYLELESIGCFGASVGSRHIDSRLAVNRTRLCDSNRLLVLLTFRGNNRSSGCAVRQINAVVILGRTEAAERFAVNVDACQFGVGTGGSLELDQINRSRFAVF